MVIVSWNVRDLLSASLRSLFNDLAHSGLVAEIWVVDSGSTDGTPDAVLTRFPTVRLIASVENLGFAKGNNLALKEILDQGEHAPKLIWLLNPDTEVLGGASAALIDAIEAHPQAGVVGPRLQYPDGSFQHSAFHFPGLAQLSFELLPLLTRLYNTRLNGRYARDLYEGGIPFPVDHPLGAAMMVRTDAVASVGPLEEDYWMYCEEIDWCWRMRAAGWRAYCVPAASVVHHAGQSSTQVRIPSFVALWASRAKLYARHHGPLTRRLAKELVRVGIQCHVRGKSREMVAAGDQILKAWQTV